MRRGIGTPAPARVPAQTADRDAAGARRDLDAEVKQMVIEVARVVDVSPDEIADDALLFEDLGLDSLDLLKIAGALASRYRIRLASGANLASELGSVRKIADLVRAARAPGAIR